ncbi:MAG: VanZ family protein [Lachnospiraceae bacterium]
MKKGITLALLLFWMMIICSFSAQNGNSSGSLSYEVAYKAAEISNSLLGQGKTDTELYKQAVSMQFMIRKGAHMSEYAVLAILVGLHISTYKKRPKYLFFLIWALCTAFAATDEIHQLFIPGRAGRFWDVCIDSTGSLIGVLLFLLWYDKINKKVKNYQESRK